jgi:hypothetical protein
MLMNAADNGVDVRLPQLPERGYWQELVNTIGREARNIRTKTIRLAAHSLILLGYREVS